MSAAVDLDQLDEPEGRARSGRRIPHLISHVVDPRRPAALGLTDEDLALPARHARPRTRGECPAERPCPYVGCRHHLFLEVQPSGNLHLAFPGREPGELRESCALDVADRCGASLEEVGAALGLTRERVRQIEAKALAHALLALRRAGVRAEQLLDAAPAAEPGAVRTRETSSYSPAGRYLLDLSGDGEPEWMLPVQVVDEGDDCDGEETPGTKEEPMSTTTATGRVCPVCGEAVERKGSRGTLPTYCSRSCQSKGYRERRKERQPVNDEAPAAVAGPPAAVPEAVPSDLAGLARREAAAPVVPPEPAPQPTTAPAPAPEPMPEPAPTAPWTGAGRPCNACRHFARCSWLIGLRDDAAECDWAPTRWAPAPAPAALPEPEERPTSALPPPELLPAGYALEVWRFVEQRVRRAA